MSHFYINNTTELRQDGLDSAETKSRGALTHLVPRPSPPPSDLFVRSWKDHDIRVNEYAAAFTSNGVCESQARRVKHTSLIDFRG